MLDFQTDRVVRYQGAIIDDDQILLIMHMPLKGGSPYWVIPGGGIEDGESETECVAREMKEETNLDVEVVRLILDEPGRPGEPYQRLKTYLCKPVGGTASPGYEPELEAASEYAISEVKWFDLRDTSEWGQRLIDDPFTYPQMVQIRAKLSYTEIQGDLTP